MCSASARPLQGIWASFLHGPQEAYCWEKTNAELLSSSPVHRPNLFSLLLPFALALSFQGTCLGARWCVRCRGAVPPLSELLARQSPAKPPGLWGGGGQAGQEGSCLSWRDAGKVNASCRGDASANTQACGGCLAMGCNGTGGCIAEPWHQGSRWGSPSASLRRAEQCAWCSAEEQHHPALSRAPPIRERTKSPLLRWIHAWDGVSPFCAA